jgi:IS30 family transposase
MMGSPLLTTEDRHLIWERYREGLNPAEVAQATGRAYHTVASLIKNNGGIRPPVRTRSELRLSLAEREEISRGLRARETLTVIARGIGRATSTVSREVARNGGRGGYRAH